MDLQKTDLRALLLAIQTTPGTPETLNPSNHGMLVLNGEYLFETDELEREIDKPGHGARPHVNVKRRARYTGGVELRGHATPGTAAPIGPLLRTCGFLQTLDPGVDAVYSLLGSNFPIATVAGYHAGSLVAGHDARGAITQIELSIRNFAKAQFEIMALTGATPVIDAALPSADYSAFQAPVAIETETFEVDLDGTALNAISLTLDTNAQIEIYEGSETRFVFLREFYRPTGTLRVFKAQRSAFHPENLALAHTVLEEVFAEIVGGGEVVRLDLKNVQLGVPRPADQDGLAAWDIPFKLIGSTPTDCLALTFAGAP
jgi:hypothetical protein